MTHAIETRALTRKFNDFVAVDALDLKVESGKFFGFLGPNGAGKSTTIKMLTGLLDKSSGNARVLGFDLDEEPLEAKRRIGVVPEELALFDRLNGAEYLRFVGRMYGVGAADITWSHLTARRRAGPRQNPRDRGGGHASQCGFQVRGRAGRGLHACLRDRLHRDV